MVKRSFLLAISLLAALVIAGCGSSSSTTTASTPAATATKAAPALIQTGQATVNGTSETVLVNAQGLTLYYFTPDTAKTTACTGACAQNWPPLVVADDTDTPTAAASAPGKLSVQETANGYQVAYNGHFLYTFKADTAPGQANGQGKLGQWFVATPNLAQSSS